MSRDIHHTTSTINRQTAHPTPNPISTTPSLIVYVHTP